MSVAKANTAKTGLDRPGDVMPTLELVERRRRARALSLPLDTPLWKIEAAENLRTHREVMPTGSDPRLDGGSRTSAMTGPALGGAAPLREKQVEHAGDKLMRTYGFTPIRLSQPRASKQTPGIPDRLYMHPERQLVVWWEAKKPGGKQRPAQERFQALAIASGMEYVLGGVDALRAWLTRKLEARNA